jgi:hypothetical protein
LSPVFENQAGKLPVLSEREGGGRVQRQLQNQRIFSRLLSVSSFLQKLY